MFFSIFQNDSEPYFINFNAILIFEFNPIPFHQCSNSLIIELSILKNPILRIQSYQEIQKAVWALLHFSDDIEIAACPKKLYNIHSLYYRTHRKTSIAMEWLIEATPSPEYLFVGFCFYGHRSSVSFFWPINNHKIIYQYFI